MPQNLKEKGPRHRVKCLRDIKLQKYARLFLLMKKPCSLLHKHEIVLNKSSFDEGTLDGRDHFLQLWSKPIGQQLRN
jgi:hypothetical protein